MPMFDYVVVGGGIVGASVALRLTEMHPGCSLALLERSLIANGASRFSAGLHVPNGVDVLTRERSRMSGHAYEKLAAREPGLSIRPLQAIALGSSERAVEHIERFLDVPVALSRAEVDAALTPQLRQTVPLLQGWRICGAHVADVSRIAEGHVRKVCASPATELWEGCKVVHVETAPLRPAVHLHDGQRIDAQRLIIAPGAWAVAHPFGGLLAELALRTKKIVSLHIGLRPSGTAPLILLLDDDAFLLPLPERGCWLFSYTCTDWDVDPDTISRPLEAADREDALRLLRRYSEPMAQHCIGGRVSCDAYSSDRAALVTGIGAGRSTAFVGAASGAGYRLAPALAVEAGNWLDG